VLTPVERVLILRGADLLKDVGPRHLLGLATVSREVPIFRGDTIYLDDDAADALYIVVEGRVKLSSQGRAMSEVGPGEAFGTWSLVDDSARGHRAECVADGLTLALAREDFYEVAAADLTILKELVRVLAKRLRELAAVAPPEESRVEEEGTEKVAEKSGGTEGTEAPASAGAALADAAAGRTPPPGEEAEPAVPIPATEEALPLDPLVSPEPIVAPEPPQGSPAPSVPPRRSNKP